MILMQPSAIMNSLHSLYKLNSQLHERFLRKSPSRDQMMDAVLCVVSEVIR